MLVTLLLSTRRNKNHAALIRRPDLMTTLASRAVLQCPKNKAFALSADGPTMASARSKTADNNDRDRGRIAADPSHTTGHAGPHPAVRFLEANLLQITSRLASPCLLRYAHRPPRIRDVNFRCANTRSTQEVVGNGFCSPRSAHPKDSQSLYRVSVRYPAALARMLQRRFFAGLPITFAGFLSTVGHPSAVAIA